MDQISERAEVGPREIRARFGDTKQLARVLLDYERTAWAAWEKTIRGRSLTGVAAVRELLLLAANHYATDQRLQGAARLAVESHHIDPRRPHPYKRQLQVLRRAVGRDLSGLPDGTTADGFTATVLATFAGLTTAVNGQWADLPERIGQFWDLLKTTI